MKSCGPQWPHLTHSGWNYPIQYNEQHSNKQTNKQKMSFRSYHTNSRPHFGFFPTDS